MSLKGKRILIVGDSHTEGPFGKTLKASLVEQGAAVQRIAVVGASASWFLEGGRAYKAALPELVAPYDLAVVAFGTNEAASTAGGAAAVERAATAIRTLADRIDASKVLWVGPPAFHEAIAAKYSPPLNVSAAAIWDATAPKFGANAIDSRPLTAAYALSNNIHLGPKGGAAWAAGVFPAIDAALADRPPTVPPPPPPKDKIVGGFPWKVVIGVGALAAGVFVVSKTLGASPRTAMAGLPKSGRIPLATVRRALTRLGSKARKCGIDASSLREGMEVEREHRDVTKGAVLKTARIAAAHLCERPDYYRRLKKFVE